VFEEPKGLLLCRPNLDTGHFCIHVIAGSQTPYRPPYRIMTIERGQWTKQILGFKRNGLIRDSQSPIVAPLLFVTESLVPHGSKEIRIGINNQALNEVPVNDRFLRLISEDLGEKLKGITFVSKRDFNAGYHQR
jgi:hypothetical protein